MSSQGRYPGSRPGRNERNWRQQQERDRMGGKGLGRGFQRVAGFFKNPEASTGSCQPTAPATAFQGRQPSSRREHRLYRVAESNGVSRANTAVHETNDALRVRKVHKAENLHSVNWTHESEEAKKADIASRIGRLGGTHEVSWTDSVARTDNVARLRTDRGRKNITFNTSSLVDEGIERAGRVKKADWTKIVEPIDEVDNDHSSYGNDGNDSGLGTSTASTQEQQPASQRHLIQVEPRTYQRTVAQNAEESLRREYKQLYGGDFSLHEYQQIHRQHTTAARYERNETQQVLHRRGSLSITHARHSRERPVSRVANAYRVAVAEQAQYEAWGRDPHAHRPQPRNRRPPSEAHFLESDAFERKFDRANYELPVAPKLRRYPNDKIKVKNNGKGDDKDSVEYFHIPPTNRGGDDGRMFRVDQRKLDEKFNNYADNREKTQSKSGAKCNKLRRRYRPNTAPERPLFSSPLNTTDSQQKERTQYCSIARKPAGNEHFDFF